MTAITDFTQARVIPEVIGCPIFVAVESVRDAAIEFCNRSRYWRVTLASINIVAGQATYTLIPPTDSSISEILSVRHNTFVVNPTSEFSLDGQYPSWRLLTSSQAEEYFSNERNIIRLTPIPSVSGTANLDVRVVLKPSRTSTTIPDQLYDHYLEEVAAGAKARLMVMPGVDWSNPDLALYYRTVFESGIKNARGVAVTGYNATPVASYTIA